VITRSVRQFPGELVAAGIPRMVHVHLQLRGEPGRLTLPVADHGHRAHHQRGRRPSSLARRRRSGLHIVHDQAQRLRGLAEPHIIGEDAAKAETAEEGQPRHPALLIGAQLAVEAGRRLDRFEPAVGPAGEQVAEPAVGVHLDQRQVVVGSVQAGQQRVRSPHRPGLAALQEPQRRAEVPVVEFHPLAAQPDQRDLEPGQLGQLPGVQLLVADRQVVAEVDQVAEAELRVGHRPARGSPGPGGELESEPGPAHPVRQQHAEPGAGQQRRCLPEEAERLLGVQCYLGRRRAAQRPVQLGEEPGGPAQPGQQLLLRVLDPGGQAGRGSARPDVGSRHHQARVVGGLERELDPPVPGDLARRPAAAAGIRGVLGGT
jgi:hypothetical protein